MAFALFLLASQYLWNRKLHCCYFDPIPPHYEVYQDYRIINSLCVYKYAAVKGGAFGLDEKQIICICQNVTLGKLRNAVNQGADTYELLQRETGCGRSCAMCVGTIKDYLYQLSLLRLGPK